MSKTLVIFGSTTGTLEEYARSIADKLGAPVENIAHVDVDKFQEYDNLILGTSTWGAGEIQDDWYSGLEKLKQVDLEGKTVALYGCGDAAGYGDTFCSGMREIYDAVKGKGAKLVGEVDAGTYSYDDSASVIDGKFVGLALDVNEDNDQRVASWVEVIKSEL